MIFLQIQNYSSQRLLKTTGRTQITTSSTNIETPSSIIDTQTEVLNTKISKVDQNDLVIAYYCSSCAIPVIPDHEEISDCSCELMATNDKQVNLSMLISCYGIHSDVKKFAKSIITTPVKEHYHNVNQTIFC